MYLVNIYECGCQIKHNDKKNVVIDKQNKNKQIIYKQEPLRERTMTSAFISPPPEINKKIKKNFVFEGEQGGKKQKSHQPKPQRH